MTPKEKAKELVEKIYYCQRYKDGEDYIPLEAYKRAKQCTLIAVDEIIDFSCYMMPEVKESMMDYLDEVKKEIEKL
jgi:hypothetical protein